MKEKEFIKKYKTSIIIPIYFSLSSKGHVNVDIDSMREEFDDKLGEIYSTSRKGRK